MSKDLADVLDADPLALAPDKDEYELKYLAPMERIAREEEELKEEKKELKKQLTKLWGLHPAAHPLADKLGKLSPDDRIKVLRGAALILRHNGETLPEDLFHADRLVPGRGIEEGADSPVDDGAKAGKATARKPRSKRDEPDAGANGEIRAAESALPLEDALRAFEENQHKAPTASPPKRKLKRRIEPLLPNGKTTMKPLKLRANLKLNLARPQWQCPAPGRVSVLAASLGQRTSPRSRLHRIR